ncbi:hypothetical protein DFH09DRAFT_1097779 [Mycena vulgaris]|nr:hypothetical protein DFH09DRAFT_1097779 [Mycena vulgaris]
MADGTGTAPVARVPSNHQRRGFMGITTTQIGINWKFQLLATVNYSRLLPLVTFGGINDYHWASPSSARSWSSSCPFSESLAVEGDQHNAVGIQRLLCLAQRRVPQAVGIPGNYWSAV